MAPMQAPLPPGTRGLPGIGETLPFLRDGFGFIEERLARHGPVFRTNLLGKNAVVIAGPDASRAWIDPEKVERDRAMPANVQEIFGGRSLPLLDDAEHRARKQQVLAGFNHAALADYASQMQPLMRTALESWSDPGAPTRGVDALKRLAIDVIGRNVLGLEAGARLDALRESYGVLTLGMTALPVPVPGSKYRRALAARDRILQILREEVARVRAEPGAACGLSRMLEAQAEDGSRLSDDSAVLELHHVVIAGYIVFAELVRVMQELARDGEIRRRIRSELDEVVPRGEITTADLRRLPFTLQVVKESKRLTPIVSVVFGKARTDFELAGRRIPRGWMLLWAPHSSMLWPSAFAEPRRFDPDRFSAERDEGADEEIIYVPQGPGRALGHKCPGVDYATLIMQVFLAHLVRDHEWEIPDQDMTMSWDRIPPEPRDGLLFRLHRRAVA
ncbi:MAG: cytochrome P450 [Candidatus Eisenbacteria bacterium]|uniref:Cytochrome P450 n=1 Tax=Eiseniibacteriota bacterium TaxID=2212470 RepID=A0A956RPJ4_UNCEI|nr:cytochrome P450 [Candidatus Eisenbacteria bacterium]